MIPPQQGRAWLAKATPRAQLGDLWYKGLGAEYAPPPELQGTQTMRSKALLLGSFIALLAVPAMAQGNNAINFIGTVDKVDASSITVKMEESTETVKIAPNVLYLQNKPAKLTDIKANDFVASAAVRKADGKLHSTELRIFPHA